MIIKNELSQDLLLADTISHQVRNVSGEIKLSLREKIMLSMNLSFQNDMSIDISGHAQLTANIRYLEIPLQATSFPARNVQCEQMAMRHFVLLINILKKTD
jgi:hypothetical protein